MKDKVLSNKLEERLKEDKRKKIDSRIILSLDLSSRECGFAVFVGKKLLESGVGKNNFHTVKEQNKYNFPSNQRGNSIFKNVYYGRYLATEVDNVLKRYDQSCELIILIEFVVASFIYPYSIRAKSMVLGIILSLLVDLKYVDKVKLVHHSEGRKRLKWSNNGNVKVKSIEGARQFKSSLINHNEADAICLGHAFCI